MTDRCTHPPRELADDDTVGHARLQGGTVEALAETFRMLGDPTRIRILDALGIGERCVCDIAALVGISQSAVSHQLRLLRSLRLVRPRRVGRQVFYALDDHHIVGLLRLALTHVEEPAAVPLPEESSPEIGRPPSRLDPSSASARQA